MSRALERLLILHEDHEQNASTSTVRLVGSTGANLFSSISAGINALYGLHGGANEAKAFPRRLALDSSRATGESFVQRFRERAGEQVRCGVVSGWHRLAKNWRPRGSS